jgi:hypothetical protein
MSDAAIEHKFRANAEPVIGRANADKIVDLAWQLERVVDVRSMTALLAG